MYQPFTQYKLKVLLLGEDSCKSFDYSFSNPLDGMIDIGLGVMSTSDTSHYVNLTFPGISDKIYMNKKYQYFDCFKQMSPKYMIIPLK